MVSDGSDAVRNGDALESGTVVESVASDVCYAVGNDQFRDFRSVQVQVFGMGQRI